VVRVDLAPGMLDWAIERAGRDGVTDLVERFDKLEQWKKAPKGSNDRPTYKQLEKFARAAHIPMGYLLLPQPLDEKLPIADFRELDKQEINAPSPNLLATIYACQRRQGWYRELMQAQGKGRPSFIGNATLATDPQIVVSQMWELLGFGKRPYRGRRDSTAFLNKLKALIEDAGVLVMSSSTVRNSPRRKLDPDKFRGFVLCDDLAPLIFINGADTTEGKVFTLIHELAHLWLYESGISDANMFPLSVEDHDAEEVWCDQVATEFLMPLSDLRIKLQEKEDYADGGAIRKLSQNLKISSLILLRRLHDLDAISENDFHSYWGEEWGRLQDNHQKEKAETPSKGGVITPDRMAISRVGRRFAQALVVSTLEGGTLYRDALRMLGVKKADVFDRIAREMQLIE